MARPMPDRLTSPARRRRRRIHNVHDVPHRIVRLDLQDASDDLFLRLCREVGDAPSLSLGVMLAEAHIALGGPVPKRLGLGDPSAPGTTPPDGPHGGVTFDPCIWIGILLERWRVARPDDPTLIWIDQNGVKE